MDFEKYHHEHYEMFEEFFFEAIQLRSYKIARRRLDELKDSIAPKKWSNLDTILKEGENAPPHVKVNYNPEGFKEVEKQE